MQIYMNMKKCKYASKVCNYANMQVCKYVSMQVPKHTSMQVYRYAIMHACKVILKCLRLQAVMTKLCKNGKIWPSHAKFRKYISNHAQICQVIESTYPALRRNEVFLYAHDQMVTRYGNTN